MIKEHELFIDIDKILKKKNSKLYKLLPEFSIRYIKKTVRQDELNYIIDSWGHLGGLEFLDKILKYFNITSEIKGIEKLPKNKKSIFVANHPIGGMDGMVFMHEMGKIYGPTKSIINDILMSIKGLSPLFIGVNKHGGTPRETLLELDKVFSSDIPILIFPAGLASRKVNGKIEDLEWKKTFITRAIHYKRDVVPIHINGRLSDFFYNISKIRTFFGIKTNLEMLYLSDETFKQAKKHFILSVGDTISYESFDKSKKHIEWAQVVKNKLYQIPQM